MKYQNNDNEKDNQLVLEAQKGNSSALLEICQKYTPLIKKYAHASHVATLGEDLESELWLLFLESIYRYNPDKKVPLAGYFQSVIKYGQWNIFKKNQKIWQQEQLGLENSDKKKDSTKNIPKKEAVSEINLEESIINNLVYRSTHRQLIRALSILNKDELELVLRHYQKKESLAQIAKSKGYSRQGISYQHTQILRKLKKQLDSLN